MNKLLQNIELYLMDMDGTVYVAGNKIEGAFETIDMLKAQGKRVCFLTNNSSRSTNEYIQKLHTMGVNIQKEDLISSIHATIYYINKYHKGERTLVIGCDSVVEEFIQNGINVVTTDPTIAVLTFDTTLNYSKITAFSNALYSGAKFVITHPDHVCPYSPYDLVDVGAMVEMFTKATGTSPEVICGKPSKIMADFVEEKFGYTKSQIAICGDRLYTDIKFGVDNGYTSILVFTGETTKEMAQQSDIKATVELDSFAEILK